MPLDISIEGKRKGLLGTLSSLDIYSLPHFPIILGNVKKVPQFTQFINFVLISSGKTNFSMAFSLALSCYHTFDNIVVQPHSVSAGKFEQDLFVLIGYINLTSRGEPF